MAEGEGPSKVTATTLLPGDIYQSFASFWPSYCLTIICHYEGMDPLFSDVEIEEFRIIWREEFGEELTIDRARAEAESLLGLVYQMRSIHQRALRRRRGQAREGSSGFDSNSNGMTSGGVG